MSVYKIYIHFFFHYFNYCGMVTLLFGLSMIGFILLEGQKCYWMPCVELLTWYRLEYVLESLVLTHFTVWYDDLRSLWIHKIWLKRARYIEDPTIVL